MPGCDSRLSAWPGSEVTVWFVSGPAQFQVTVSPCWTVTVGGANLNPPIDTSDSEATAGATSAITSEKAVKTSNRATPRVARIRSSSRPVWDLTSRGTLRGRGPPEGCRRKRSLYHPRTPWRSLFFSSWQRDIEHGRVGFVVTVG